MSKTYFIFNEEEMSEEEKELIIKNNKELSLEKFLEFLDEGFEESDIDYLQALSQDKLYSLCFQNGWSNGQFIFELVHK